MQRGSSVHLQVSETNHERCRLRSAWNPSLRGGLPLQSGGACCPREGVINYMQKDECVIVNVGALFFSHK